MNRDELTEILEQHLVQFAGQISKHVDAQIEAQTNELNAEMRDRFDRLETMVDAVAERVATDSDERAAILSEQRRHHSWIDQLAKANRTKLVPPVAD